MATIRIEEKLGGYSFRADYNIPHIVADTKVQQFIKEALTFTSVDGVQNCSLTKDKDIFTDLTQLYQEMKTNQFLFNLYKYMYKRYREIDEPVGEGTILILFNLAFKIACAALNTENPTTKILLWDKRIKDHYIRNLEFAITWFMVYIILNEEKEKTQFMELFLDDLKTDFWFERENELFDSITHTTPDKVEHMQKSETKPSARDENKKDRKGKFYYNIAIEDKRDEILQAFHEIIESKQNENQESGAKPTTLGVFVPRLMWAAYKKHIFNKKPRVKWVVAEFGAIVKQQAYDKEWRDLEEGTDPPELTEIRENLRKVFEKMSI